jgi:hypothetical protein
VESQAWFQAPTGHHTRWFCERTAKVGENWKTSEWKLHKSRKPLLNRAWGFEKVLYFNGNQKQA